MTTDANGNPVTTQDATAILSSELASWGFGQDAVAWATQQIQSNDSIDQILYSLRTQPFYVNSVFGQVATARTKAGLPAMTESQILSYQDYATGVAQQAGLPAGFINTPELVQLMGNDVSTAELDARITTAYTAYEKADPTVKASLQNYYNVTPGQAAAYFLDPTRALPLLQQQFTAAQMGGAAQVTGYTQATGNALSQAQAENMAQLGTTQTQAETGFTKLAEQSQLFNPLPGENQPAIGEEQQLGAEFGGNATDQRAITEEAQSRENVFAGNYHYAETQGRGITGLGSVPRNG